MAEIGEPVNEGSLKEESSSRKSSKQSLNKGSRKSSKQSSKDGSISDVKAQIFASGIKDDASEKPSNISGVKSCDSPSRGSRGSIKSQTSRTSATRASHGSTDSAGPCKTFITTSTGSIRSVEVKKSSRTPSTARGSEELLQDEKVSRGSLISPKEEIDVYDEGPCKIHDIVSIGSHESRSSALQVAQSTIQRILDENIPISSMSIVKEIVEKAMDRSSATEIVRDILEEIFPDSKTLIASLRKSQQIDFMPDDVYLKKHLGIPLTQALAEIVMKQPEDPIHYLAHWLFKWRWNEQHRQEKDDEINALTMERERLKEEAEEKARIEAEQKAREEEREMAMEEARFVVQEAIEHAFEALGIEDNDEEAQEYADEEERDALDAEAEDLFETEEDI